MVRKLKKGEDERKKLRNATDFKKKNIIKIRKRNAKVE